MNSQQTKRFWSKVDKSGGDDACWLWLGGCNSGGYGRFQANKNREMAHRIAWQLVNGEIPEGLFVLHNCPSGDAPRCVNPKHLFLGTQQDNVADMIRKGRLVVGKGERHGFILHPEKRPRGERHGNAKLTSEQVEEIRRIYAGGGVTQKEIGKMFGMSNQEISNIIRGAYWKADLLTWEADNADMLAKFAAIQNAASE